MMVMILVDDVLVIVFDVVVCGVCVMMMKI